MQQSHNTAATSIHYHSDYTFRARYVAMDTVKINEGSRSEWEWELVVTRRLKGVTNSSPNPSHVKDEAPFKNT
jgi:hypothetical protein